MMLADIFVMFLVFVTVVVVLGAIECWVILTLGGSFGVVGIVFLGLLGAFLFWGMVNWYDNWR